MSYFESLVFGFCLCSLSDISPCQLRVPVLFPVLRLCSTSLLCFASIVSLCVLIFVRRETGEKLQMSARTCPLSLCGYNPTGKDWKKQLESRSSWLYSPTCQKWSGNKTKRSLCWPWLLLCCNLLWFLPVGSAGQIESFQEPEAVAAPKGPGCLLLHFFAVLPPPLTPLDMTASEITSGLIHCDIQSLLLTSIDRCPAYHPLWVYYIQDLKQSLNFEITSSHFLLFDVLLHIICQEFNHTWRFSQIWIFYGHKYDLIN